MKQFILIIIVFVFFACSSEINEEKEKAEIKNLLENESKYAASGDLENWSSCWVNGDEASFVMTSIEGNQSLHGITEIKESIASIEPFELKLSRDNYHFVFGDDMAFVTYNQKDNWGGEDTRKNESRTLKKVDGEWKIVNTTVVDVSSFEPESSESFHMTATRLPVNPKTGFTNISGIAGMSIGYVEVPAGTDFTPLFKGLPHDMCNSPHWGYMIEGSADLVYADGKTETVKAGEVFYMPAPHTGKTETGAKFVDFSPDEDFTMLMDQIAKNMAVMQTSNE
jgi:mannose-6-phosphate isomerase-like protein (cupin superfamily)